MDSDSTRVSSVGTGENRSDFPRPFISCPSAEVALIQDPAAGGGVRGGRGLHGRRHRPRPVLLLFQER